jgi:outer membrane protein TolC
MRGLVMGIAFLLALPAARVCAQTAPAAANGWQAVFFESPAVALPLLQAAAVRHSASVGSFEKGKSIIREDVQLARKDILGSVALAGTYNYGNLTGGTVIDPNNPSIFGAESKPRHSVGVNLTLPLDRLAGRRNLIQKQELRYQQADLQRQDRESSLRQEVIQRYQEVLLARKTLTLYQQAFLAAQTDHELAERQFREGQSSLSELSQVNSRYSQAAIAQESAISQYETSFLLLEELVGGRLSDLMTTK